MAVKRLEAAYITPLPRTPEALGTAMQAEHERLGKLIASSASRPMAAPRALLL